MTILASILFIVLCTNWKFFYNLIIEQLNVQTMNKTYSTVIGSPFKHIDDNRFNIFLIIALALQVIVFTTLAIVINQYDIEPLFNIFKQKIVEKSNFSKKSKQLKKSFSKMKTPSLIVLNRKSLKKSFINSDKLIR